MLIYDDPRTRTGDYKVWAWGTNVYSNRQIVDDSARSSIVALHHET